MRRDLFTAALQTAWAAAILIGASHAPADESQPQSAPPVQTEAAVLSNQPISLEPSASDDSWRIEAFGWIWMLSVSGDAGARGTTADISASFSDILEASDSLLAFAGHLEVGRGDWSVYLDGMYSKLGADDQTGPLGIADVDVISETTTLDFGVMYRVADWTPKGSAASNRHRTTLDLYAGGRYTDLKLTLRPALLAEQSRSESWVDPIIGARVGLPLSGRWMLRVNGDVGGFGVSSDFTWSTTGVLGYDFTLFGLPSTLYAGYRGMGTDYHEGSGADEFAWDAVLHGPIIGLDIAF